MSGFVQVFEACKITQDDGLDSQAGQGLKQGACGVQKHHQAIKLRVFGVNKQSA